VQPISPGKAKTTGKQQERPEEIELLFNSKGPGVHEWIEGNIQGKIIRSLLEQIKIRNTKQGSQSCSHRWLEKILPWRHEKTEQQCHKHNHDNQGRQQPLKSPGVKATQKRQGRRRLPSQQPAGRQSPVDRLHRAGAQTCSGAQEKNPR
jgi:hypothetical protein